MERMFRRIFSFFSFLINSIIRPFLKATIGQLSWAPPAWFKKIWDKLAAKTKVVATDLNKERVDRPGRFWGATVLAVLIAFGGVRGYNWYKNRPKPYTLTATASAPAPTGFYDGATPNQVVITFSGSAAPLERVGKELTGGIQMTPAQPGKWNWVSDTSLVFTPSQEWPVGANFQVKFEKELTASHVLLSSRTVEFRTASFNATYEKAEFYQDPTDPKIKKVVATVRFSHPVDKGDFEKHIGLKMRIEPVKSFDESGVKPLEFKVSYNDKLGQAYIHSVPFEIPPDEGEVLVKIEKGAKAALGGQGLEQATERTVHIPGLEQFFRINSVTAQSVLSNKDEMERIATISSSAAMEQGDLAQVIEVKLLPKDLPAIGDREESEDYQWSDPLEVTPEVIAKSTVIKPTWIPTEQKNEDTQSFKFDAPAGRYFFLKIKKGLKAFGGYPLAKDYTTIVRAEQFPRMVKVLHEGSLLSMSGDKKLSVVARNVPAVRLEFTRLLPSSVNHLVTISDAPFNNPSIRSYNFGLDNIAERFEEIMTIPAVDPGKNQYFAVDFSKFMRTDAPPRGLFMLKVQAWDPEKKKPLTTKMEESSYEGGDGEGDGEEGYEGESNSYNSEEGAEASDSRLVLVTDLGFLVKDNIDGTHELFAMSLRDGTPVQDAEVQLLGANGLALASARTDAEGRVSLPKFSDFKRERAPTVYVVQKDTDLSFLPYERRDREINTSRFDTGGLVTTDLPKSLQAYLFSDRGIYRPGEQIHVGMIVKKLDWQPLPKGLPLELVITDPRSIEIKRQSVKFSHGGFETFDFSTQENSLTGSYQFALYVIRDNEERALLGTTVARVEEFQPDRLAIKANFSPEAPRGWLLPQDVQTEVELRNLYGTPAVGNTIKATFSLTPSQLPLSGYEDYTFAIKQEDESFSNNDLGEQQSDDEGKVSFDLGLNNYDLKKGAYRLRYISEGFELGAGRSVVAELNAFVLDTPYVIGYKADGDLNYIKRGTKRVVDLLAVDQGLAKIAAPDLSAKLIERRYVSTLVKKTDGTFAYQSVLKETTRETRELAIADTGTKLELTSSEPGSFVWVIENKSGDELAKIAYDIIGEANVTRELERNAELKLKLNKQDYAPGEEIEVSVEAPYTGAALITIERDKVYAAQWFKTDTTTSVQRIRLPEALEGNGYITVNFLRSMDSKEIFMSPLSSGVVPFSVSRERRTQHLELNAPTLIKPGSEIKIDYNTGTPARLIIFGADEGILQVARYKKPDPLGYIFRKKALEVRTEQILDMLLPDYELVRSLSAPGGDDDGSLGSRLNPFKRKGEKPVIFWSGVIESTGAPGSVAFSVPDYFNGSVKLFAVAVSDGAIGVVERKTEVRGPFIIQPHAPYVVAPGDEFEVTAIVSNQLAGSGENATVEAKLDLCPALEAKGEVDQKLPLGEGKQSVVSFPVKARAEFGACAITYSITSGNESARYRAEISVRPAVPYMTTVTSQSAQSGWLSKNKAELPVTRKTYPNDRIIEASASTLPIGLVRGFIHYYDRYPYGCTEQTVSQALPGMVLGTRPDFGFSVDKTKKSFEKALAILQGRQNAAGAFGTWSANSDVSPFLSIYATHFLIEARERGFNVPQNTLNRAIDYLKDYVRGEPTSLSMLRTQGYALYLLARNGVVVTNELTALREKAEKSYGNWKQDLSAGFFAATYSILHLDKEAEALIKNLSPGAEVTTDYGWYYDDLLYRSGYLYLLAKHFPDKAQKLTAEDLIAVTKPITAGRANTLSMGFAVLALDTYSKMIEQRTPPEIQISQVISEKPTPLTLTSGLFPTATVSPDATKLLYNGSTDFPLFYQLVEAGYDTTLPTKAESSRLEIIHEITNGEGTVTDKIGISDSIQSRILLRSLDGNLTDIAVVDLIPGGFEVDISPQALGNRESLPVSQSVWQPTYIDVREDRVIFYGHADKTVKAFSYRLKPTNRGKFTVPPAFGEGMYDRSIVAHSAGSLLTVAE